jgi:hypothetical protein
MAECLSGHALEAVSQHVAICRECASPVWQEDGAGGWYPADRLVREVVAKLWPDWASVDTSTEEGIDAYDARQLARLARIGGPEAGGSYDPLTGPAGMFAGWEEAA